MTKLKPDIKPDLNIHTMKDRYKARAHLSRLVDILDSTPESSKTELDVIASLKRRPLREVDV